MERTSVSLTYESEPSTEPPGYLVRLGDVVLADTLHAVPYSRIWAALAHHRNGRPGDTDLFAWPSSLGPKSLHISWWKGSAQKELYCPPIWVLTAFAEPRLTSVFAMASEAPSGTRH